MKNEDLNILWLDLFENLSYSKKIKLLSLVEKGECLRKKFLKNPEIQNSLSKQEFAKMALCLSDEFLMRHIRSYQDDNIELITFNDEKYPYMLREISSPPLCLYCKGNTQLLNSFCFGVVGTRKPTEYGMVVTKQYCKALCTANLTIVSGLAVGIDSVAHKTALEENGNTIAVLASGFKHVYPSINNMLANKITENNLIMSEYPPNTKPQSYYFPVRNRIIAGLSKGILVPEMGEKSGTMHTINYALENNRELFVVPGKINSEMSKGTNMLIKTLQASITTTPDDILEAFHIKNSAEKIDKQVDIVSQLILEFLKTEKHTFQEILEHTNLSANELNVSLMMLEMEGLILKVANNSYIAT